MSKAMEAAAWEGVRAAFEYRHGKGTCPDSRLPALQAANKSGAWESEIVAGRAAISAYLKALAEDEAVVERMARAMAEYFGDSLWDDYEGQARAALAAIEEQKP